MQSAPIDILFGGAYSIKAYYGESGNPKQMRGASELLTSMFKKYIKDLVEPCQFNREKYPYYDGGSQMFAVLEHGSGEPLLKKIEDKFREVCQTARFSIICMLADEAELEGAGFSSLMERLLSASYEKRMSFIPNFEQEDDGDDWLLTHKYVTAIPVSEESSAIEGRAYCDRCRNRPAHYKVAIPTPDGVASDSLSLCTACTKKEMQGRNAPAENDIAQMSNLEDNNGDVAFLYADINNLGGMGAGLKSYKERSQFFSDIDNAVSTALEDIKLLIGYPHQVIACGGDDVCLLLPGNKALIAAVGLASAFDNIWSQGNSKRDMHLSVGVTIADSKTPIDIFHNMTEKLIKSAKDRARSVKSAGHPQSCIDIYRLGADGQYSTDLRTLRAFNDPYHPLFIAEKGISLTLFPMTVNEGQQFIKILKAAESVSTSRLRNIVDGSKRKNTIQGSLYFQYLYARHKNDVTFQQLVERIYAFPGINANHPRLYYDRDDGMKVSIWHDILALITQITGDVYE